MKKVLVKLCNLNYNESDDGKNVEIGGRMKDFISKNWKKIFYIIGGIIIVVDLFFIITTPGTIPQDFYEYGPTIESDIFDNTIETADKVKDEAKDEITEGENLLDSPVDSPVSGDSILSSTSSIPKGLIIFGIIFIVIFALSGVIEGSGGSSKKKK